MSGLAFIVLVLQISNSFNLNVFFSIFLLFISSWLQGPPWIVAFRGRVFHWVVWSRLEVFFFRLKSSIFFPVRTHVFGRSFIFCNFCLYWWGFDFAPARGSPASVSDYDMTCRDYIKVEHVRNWLRSSSLASFQQYHSECFFFSFSSVYLLLVTRSTINRCFQGACVSLGCLV